MHSSSKKAYASFRCADNNACSNVCSALGQSSRRVGEKSGTMEECDITIQNITTEVDQAAVGARCSVPGARYRTAYTLNSDICRLSPLVQWYSRPPSQTRGRATVKTAPILTRTLANKTCRCNTLGKQRYRQCSTGVTHQNSKSVLCSG